MIVREQPRAIELFFALQGSIVPCVFGKIAFVFLLTTFVTSLDRVGIDLPQVSIAAMGVFGVALSLFLGFRNNAAYDRWWEARKQWGIIIAETRALARHLHEFVDASPEHRIILANIVAFAHLHRGHLRGVDVRDDLAPWVGEAQSDLLISHQCPPDRALCNIADQLRELAKKGEISGFGQMAVSKTLSSIGLAQAGNERIHNTPLPFVYSLLVRRTTYLYCVLLPFALVNAASILAPILAGVVAYVFFGLQAVTNELELPFRDVQNGLPLDAMCRTIEISVCESLDLPAPEALDPKQYILT